jgi:hypothetical protein
MTKHEGRMTKSERSQQLRFVIDSSFIIRIPSFTFARHHDAAGLPRNFSYKICCDLLEARLVATKFFTIVLGGTAALHTYRVWGAVIFWGECRAFFSQLPVLTRPAVVRRRRVLVLD